MNRGTTLLKRTRKPVITRWSLSRFFFSRVHTKRTKYQTREKNAQVPLLWNKKKIKSNSLIAPTYFFKKKIRAFVVRVRVYYTVFFSFRDSSVQIVNDDDYFYRRRSRRRRPWPISLSSV